MKIAVIGGGGREHAIIDKLAQSKNVDEIVAIPGNGGIQQLTKCVPLSPTNIVAVVDYCVENLVDYVVVAPDDPLALGMVDKLAERGIPAFGPSKAAAQIEASKVFAKTLMRKYNIPTANYEVFSDKKAAFAYVCKQNTYPVVIKADGLALGKGVLICMSEAEAENALIDILDKQIFGQSGAKVVIEEFLQGPEVSVLAFCDGKTLVPMLSSMDHKRAFDDDKGPNTGGMGVIAPNPYYTQDVAQQCIKDIFLPTVDAMQKEGAPFKGCLYFGLILCADGPKVIEYNCRFGDPETQAVLPLLTSDLLEIFIACTQGALTQEMVQFANASSACIVLASGGYPIAYAKDLPISGIKDAESMGCKVYHAGTYLLGDTVYTSGGRVLNVTAVADDLSSALQHAYGGAKCIHFDKSFFRQDIGQSALKCQNSSKD